MNSKIPLVVSGTILLFVLAIRIVINDPDSYVDGFWMAAFLLWIMGTIFGLARDVFPGLLLAVNLVLLGMAIMFPWCQKIDSNKALFYRTDPEARAYLTSKLGNGYEKLASTAINDYVKSSLNKDWKKFKDTYSWKTIRSSSDEAFDFFDQAWIDHESWFENHKYPKDGKPPFPSPTFMDKYTQSHRPN